MANIVLPPGDNIHSCHLTKATENALLQNLLTVLQGENIRKPL